MKPTLDLEQGSTKPPMNVKDSLSSQVVRVGLLYPQYSQNVLRQGLHAFILVSRT